VGTSGRAGTGARAGTPEGQRQLRVATVDDRPPRLVRRGANGPGGPGGPGGSGGSGGPGGPTGPGGRGRGPGGPRGPRARGKASPAQLRAIKVRFRRALTLLLLTLAAPGSAQRIAGAPLWREKLGSLVLRVYGGLLALVALLALIWLIHREFVLGVFTHELILRALAMLLIVAGIGWPLLTIDAWRLGEVRTLPVNSRRQLAALAGLMALVTCAVPIAAGRRVWAAADLIGDVFTASKHSNAVDGRYNVLLLGGDAGPDRVGTRPDSMNLASIDTATGQTSLFSLPRNLQNVHFPAGTAAARALPHGWSCGDTCLLNAIYTWGGEHKQYFPGVADPGAEAMKEAVQGVTGLKVNYYVLIDLQGFRSLIDAVGGIDIDVVAKTPIGGETTKITRWIQPGQQHLNGFHALWYARSRAYTSDYDRMARQRCVMTAMVNQLDPTTVLSNFQKIASASQQVVSTDIPAGDLPQFITLAQKAKQSQITSTQFVPPLITPKNPDFNLIRSRVAQVISDDEHGVSAPTASPAAGETPSAAASNSASNSTSKPAASAAASASPAAGKTAATASPGASAGASGGSTGAAAGPSVDVRQVCKAS
jgi:LCP family protein required for cell wall assembly